MFVVQFITIYIQQIYRCLFGLLITNGADCI